MPPKGKKVASTSTSTSRRGKRARETSPPPPPLPWEFEDPSCFNRYKVLSKRTIIPSKFFDTFTLHNLGLRNDIQIFLDNIGWTQFANIQVPTYPEITFEILSTFETNYDRFDQRDRRCISFQCMGEQRHITMTQFNDIFGFPTAGTSMNVKEFIPDHAWHQLTGQNEYQSSRSKASFIRNHSLRYIHRVMASSIFGRGESTGVVSKPELLLLWAMYNSIPINTGAWILKHLLHVSKSSTGKICVGGLLSVIATTFGFMPVQGVHHTIEGSHIVDIDTLINMRMCRHIGAGQFRLIDAGGQVIEPEEDDPYDVPQEDAPMPDEEQADVGDVPDPTTGDQRADRIATLEMQMAHLIEQFNSMQTQLGHNNERQLRMMATLERIEEKLSRLK